MRTTKLLAAVLACCTAVTAFAGTAFAADAAPDLTFDIQCAGSNTLTLTPGALEEGAVTLDLSVYVPSNPGVNGINLKFQVNDGQVAEDGTFGNYGLYLESGDFANPYCFDSENGGDPSASFQTIANPDQMNFSWVLAQSLDANADAAAEKGTTSWTSDASWAYQNALLDLKLVVPQDTAPGEYVLDVRREKYLNMRSIGTEKEVYGQSSCITADSEAAVAYKSVPFTLIVEEAKETTTTTTASETTTELVTTTTVAPVITTTEAPVITTTEAPVITTTEAPVITTTEAPVITTTEAPVTTTADGGVTGVTTLDTVPTLYDTATDETSTELADISSIVENPTTETILITTTDEIVDTTVTLAETTTVIDDVTTTTDGGSTPPTAEAWEDHYDGMSEGFYIVLGDVAGKPGEQVQVPVSIYNDPGTAGMQLYWTHTDGLVFTRYKAAPGARKAYTVSATTNKQDQYPLSYVFTTSDGKNAPTPENGALLTYMIFTIPEDAADGTVYHVDFYTANSTAKLDAVNPYSQISDQNGKIVTDGEGVSLFGGTVTVNAAGDTRLNYTSYNFPGTGGHVNLTLFNAFGDVTWKSSDEKIVTVDQNGYVTAVGLGSAVVTASNLGKDYTCSINVGLYGDIDHSGEVNAIDANLALLYYNLKDMLEADEEDLNLTSEEAQIADVNLDGHVDSKDANFINTYYNYYTIVEDEDTTWYSVTGVIGTPGSPS